MRNNEVRQIGLNDGFKIFKLLGDMFKVLFMIFFFRVVNSYGVNISVFEPSVECTVIKVVKTISALGFDSFPKRYDSINNNPLNSKLLIAGREFPKLDPETIFKTDSFERISIAIDGGALELELNGKPISRNGVLKNNGITLANVTCH